MTGRAIPNIHGYRFLYLDYFLLAHDSYSGRPHVDTEVLGVGLAGALLGDLISADCLDTGGNTVTVRDCSVPADPTARSVLDRLRRRANPVGWWVDVLGSTAYLFVGEDLVRREVVSLLPTRRLRPMARYVAADALAAATPRVLLRHAAATGSHDVHAAALAALALATGLESVVADGANRRVRGALRDLAQETPAEVKAVIDGVNAAAMRIALKTRRGR